MKLSRITLALGILLIGIAVSYASATRAEAEGSSSLTTATSESPTAQPPSSLRPCGQKSALESALFATQGPENFPSLKELGMTRFATAIKLDCTMCCVTSWARYENCLLSPKSQCQCLREAVNNCLEGGCGPCQCCADYITLGNDIGCPPIIDKTTKTTR